MIIFFILTISLLLNFYLLKKLRSFLSEIKSLQVTHGKVLEQFIPFLKNYPYDKKNFRFIGSPIDGIQFNDDEIIFIEFKTGRSKLSKKQRKIKEIINKKRVRFLELEV